MGLKLTQTFLQQLILFQHEHARYTSHVYKWVVYPFLRITWVIRGCFILLILAFGLNFWYRVTELGTCQAPQEEQMDVIQRQSVFSKYNIFLCVIVNETEFFKNYLFFLCGPIPNGPRTGGWGPLS